MSRTWWKRAGGLLAALAFFAIPAAALAQSDAGQMIPAGAPAPPPGLLVHGHSEIKATPDIAYITVSIVTQSREPATAAGENATRSQAVMAALKSAGIADKDLQTQSYGIETQYENGAHGTQILTGYQVTNSIQVTIRSLPKAGSIVDTAVKAGATNVSDLTFDLADRHHVEGEALVAAITNARSKADLMAGASGVTLGNLIRISEDSAPIVQPIFAGGFRAMAAMAPAATTPISGQQITVTADVTALYSILPGASQ